MPLLILALLCLVPGVALLALGIVGLRRRRLARALLGGTAGGILLVCGVILLTAGNQLDRFAAVWDSPARYEIRFERKAPQYFIAELSSPEGDTVLYGMHGDEWRLDVRVLSWGPLAALGLNSLYHLRALRSRYTDLDQGPLEPPETHYFEPTGPQAPWPWLVAGYEALTRGRTTLLEPGYLPMADGAIFQISVTPKGIVIQPRNAAAERAMRRRQVRRATRRPTLS